MLGIGYEVFFIKFFQIIFDMENTYSHRLMFLAFTMLVIIPASTIKNFHVYYILIYLANKNKIQ